MAQASNLRGICFMLAGAAAFVLNDSFMKLALVDFPPYEVLALRGLFGMIFALGLLGAMGDLFKLPLAFNRWVLLRGILEVGAILTYILALAKSTVGDVTAIFQTTPLLVILGMVLIHREATNFKLMSLVVLGFVGALMVAQPGSGATSPYLLFAFLTALFAALRDLAGRRVSDEVPALAATFITIVLVFIGAMVVGLGFENWVAPQSHHIWLLMAASFAMMLGHMFIFLAYRNASAQAVAPFYYAFLIWAVIGSYFIFGDVPNWLAVGGMALIVGSGLAIVYFENRSKKHSSTPSGEVLNLRA
jgi:drug/metabolite transporter (DMT)-like permease